MRVYVESILRCSAAAAWEAAQTSALLLEIVWPLVTIHAARGEELPERWTTDLTFRCRIYLFGLIPLGVRTICFQLVDARCREIHTREHDALVRRWDHAIRIRHVSGTECHYSDEIEIEAGKLTRVVATFAKIFYRHRQRRWQRVARRINSLGNTVS